MSPLRIPARLVSLAIAIMFLIGAGTTASEDREPWQIPLDERIAARTNPVLAQRRAERSLAAALPVQSASAGWKGTVADRFTGRDDAALFLPFEVFQQLIRLAYISPARDDFRRAMAADLSRAGADGNVWDKLLPEVRTYVAAMEAEAAVGASIRHAGRGDRERLLREIELLQQDTCRQRAAALARARRLFGEDRFDQILYAVVAPQMFHIADALPDAAQLRRAEDGCR